MTRDVGRWMGRVFGLTAVALIAFDAAAQEKEYTIGFIPPEMTNEFWQSFMELAEKAADSLGVEIITIDAQSKEDVALTAVQNLIASGVDGIVATSVTSVIGPAMIEEVEKAGIPTVFVERWPSIGPDEWQGEQYVGFISGAYSTTGYSMMESLYEAGARNVVILSGEHGNAIAEVYSPSAHKFIDEHPDMTLVEELWGHEVREHGLESTESLLTAHPGPGFDGVWAFTDEVALGAIQALKNENVLDKVKVVGSDLTGDGVAAIEAGEMVASSGGQWAESPFALAMLYDHLNGYEPLQRVVEIPLLSVEGPEQVPPYKAQFVDSVPDYDFKALTQTHNPNFDMSLWTIKLQ